MFIVDPRYLPFPAWANSVILDNGLLPQAGDETQWKVWAAQVALIDGTAPDPMPFADWRSWVSAWIEAQ